MLIEKEIQWEIVRKDPLDLKQYIRTVDNFPIDIEFKDITSLRNTKVLLKHVMSLPGYKEFGAI